MKEAKLNVMRVPLFSKETAYKSPPTKLFPGVELSREGAETSQLLEQSVLQIPEIKNVNFKYTKLKRSSRPLVPAKALYH